MNTRNVIQVSDSDPYRYGWRKDGRPRKKPGPKPGQPHSGQFVPGDPRCGRKRKTKEMKELEALCRESSEAALAVLTDVMNDPDQPAAARLAAAREILDRGHGKPIDRQAVMQMTGGTGGESPEVLTEAQLLRIASGALTGTGGGGQVIDLRPVSDPEDG